MIKDSTDELMEQELVPQNGSNEWLRFLNTGHKPKPVFEGAPKVYKYPIQVSNKQQRSLKRV